MAGLSGITALQWLSLCSCVVWCSGSTQKADLGEASLARLPHHMKQGLETGRDPSPAGATGTQAVLLAPALCRGWLLAPQPC